MYLKISKLLNSMVQLLVNEDESVSLECDT